MEVSEVSDLKQQHVLIVDDIAENIKVLLNTLKGLFSIQVATNGQKAIEIASTAPLPDLILLDIMMPEMDGYEVLRRLKANPVTEKIPVIFVTALNEIDQELKGLQLGAVDYIIKPINPDLVISRVCNHLELKRHRDQLQELVDEKTRQLKIAQEGAVEAMGIVAENRDPETGGHILRTKNYVKILAEQLSNSPKYQNALTDEKIEYLYHAAPLHDLGKVAITDTILLKPEGLTSDEFEVMKTHTTIGEKTIESVQARLGATGFLSTARDIAGTHHEHYDGTGYPRGLKGDEIPLCGRIMALADVYDALISKRCYKMPIKHSEAVEMIASEKGKQFDPDVVDAFLELQEVFRETALEFSDQDVEREAIKN